VAELRLVFVVAEAGLHAAGLEGAEVGAGRNLAVGVLGRQPDFEVVGLGGGEAHVAGAQRHAAVRQFQLFEDDLGLAGQFLVRFGRFFRMDDLDQLDLVELVLADHAAHVAAAGTGFGTEARRVADELQRQRLGSEDFVADDVGHRHFGGRDQVERVLVAAQHLEQVFLELRQLAGAMQAGGVDQVGGIDLGVAVLGGVRIQHELGERAVQAGQAALEQREARAGNLGGGGEIELAERLADIGVILDLEIEVRGVPQRLISTLPVSSLPTGTDSSGMLGSAARMALNFSSSSPRRASEAFSSSPSAPTWAITAEASSPLPFNMPICLDRLLRCACRSWVRVCSVLRSASSAWNSERSIGLPRLARPAATASRLERRSWMSSMMHLRIYEPAIIREPLPAVPADRADCPI
jgi:hypothetical protein